MTSTQLEMSTKPEQEEPSPQLEHSPQLSPELEHSPQLSPELEHSPQLSPELEHSPQLSPLLEHSSQPQLSPQREHSSQSQLSPQREPSLPDKFAQSFYNNVLHSTAHRRKKSPRSSDQEEKTGKEAKRGRIEKEQKQFNPNNAEVIDLTEDDAADLCELTCSLCTYANDSYLSNCKMCGNALGVHVLESDSEHEEVRKPDEMYFEQLL